MSGKISPVRLRPGKDDDIATWYEKQENKSTAIRRALRHYIEHKKRSDLTGAIAQAVVGKLVRALPEVLKEAVREAVSTELDRLPETVREAVDEALRDRKLVEAPGSDEDDEMAARIDEGLESFF